MNDFTFEVDSIETKYRAKVHYIVGPGEQFGTHKRSSWHEVGSAALEGVERHIKPCDEVLGWVDFYRYAAISIRHDNQILENISTKDHYLAGGTLVATDTHTIQNAQDIILAGAGLNRYLTDWLSRLRHTDKGHSTFGSQYRKASPDIRRLMAWIPLSSPYSLRFESERQKIKPY